MNEIKEPQGLKELDQSKIHYFLFDTETTTFPNKNVLSTSRAQARVCQVGALLLNSKFEEVSSLNSYIKLNDSTVIAEGAFKAHGITKEKCNEEGRTNEEVFNDFFNLGLQAEVVVCHNFLFDRTMLEIEVANLKVPESQIRRQMISMWLDNMIPFCTMEATTNICKLPFPGKKFGNQKYKWPKLQEAYKHFFNEEFDKAHDALADVRATARIFKHLKQEFLINQ